MMGRNDEKLRRSTPGYRLKFGQSDQDQHGPKFLLSVTPPIKLRVPVRLAIDQKEAPAAGSGPPVRCWSLGTEHVILQRYKEV